MAWNAFLGAARDPSQKSGRRLANDRTTYGSRLAKQVPIWPVSSCSKLAHQTQFMGDDNMVDDFIQKRKVQQEPGNECAKHVELSEAEETDMIHLEESWVATLAPDAHSVHSVGGN